MNFLKSFCATIRPKRKEKGRNSTKRASLCRNVCLQLAGTWLGDSYGYGFLVPWSSSFPEVCASSRGCYLNVSASQPSQNSFQSQPQQSVDHRFEDYTMVSITLYKNLARKRSGWIIFQYKRIAVQRGIKERLSVMSSVSDGSFEN